MARVGRVGSDIDLGVRFYLNGVLVDPYSIDDVNILDAVGGTTLETLTPVKVSTGFYRATWSIPNSSGSGVYYDEWTWTAESGKSSQTRTYDFRVDSFVALPPRDEKGPLFVGNKEVHFFNSITKEVVQKIVAQKVIYYSVSEQHTNVHRLYDEAIKKTVYTPVEINALILYNEPVQTANQFSIDTIYSLEVYFHHDELEERNIIPREGDFVKFGTIVYEIEKLNQPQIVYGQIQNKVMIKAACRVSRKSQFEVLDNIPGYEVQGC